VFRSTCLAVALRRAGTRSPSPCVGEGHDALARPGACNGVDAGSACVASRHLRCGAFAQREMYALGGSPKARWNIAVNALGLSYPTSNATEVIERPAASSDTACISRT